MVSTCNALMALVAAGYPSDHPILRRGIEWLKSPEAERCEYSYWRLTPFISCRETPQTINQALERVENLVRGGLKHHPHFPPKAFLYTCYLVLGQALTAEAQDLADQMVKDWTPTDCWLGRATATAWNLSCLLRGNPALLSDEQVATSIDLIRKQATWQVDDRIAHWGGSLTSTSFTIQNIMATDRLRSDPELLNLCRAGKNYLLDRLDRSGKDYWEGGPEDLEYGGEVTDPEYFTAVAIRGIIAYQSTTTPSFFRELAWVGERWREERSQAALRAKEETLARYQSEKSFWELFSLSVALSGVVVGFLLGINKASIASHLQLKMLIPFIQLVAALLTIGSWAYTFSKWAKMRRTTST